MFENVDGRTDAVVIGILIAHLRAFVSGELKIILSLSIRTLVKDVYQKNNFLISQPKLMLWVFKRTVSMRRFS